MTTASAGVAWSVIVPTFSRPDRLASCVDAVAALHPPPGGFEIVVVNDGGSEPDNAVRAAALAGNATDAHFLTQANQGPGAARNLGAESARGIWLAFTDDDCAPDRDWLVALSDALARLPDALAGGAVVNALHDNVFSETSQVLVDYVAAYFDGSGRERFFTSNNIAVRREAYLEFGGFDGTFGVGAEDREFCDRWHAQRRPTIFEPHAIIRHSHHLTLASFLEQHLRYGDGARTFRAVRQDAGRPVRIDPGFYLGSLRHAARGRPFLRGLVLAGCTVAAHGAYLAGLARASLFGSPDKRGQPDIDSRSGETSP
jgi:glycosyltransferase involved in cell wall biosynthesis